MIGRRSFTIGAALAAGFGLPATAKEARLAKLSDGQVASAKGDIVEAALIGATTRYDHFVLGSRHEATGVRVTTSAGQTHELILPPDSVFEDREPRIVDLDGDGRNEIVLVRSRQSSGSALAILGMRAGELKILAETPPNGGPQRWLNPAGFGHFGATDRLQIAMVRMPHVVGRLEFWQFDGSQMTRHGSLEAVSNHRIGSRDLHMSAVIARPGKTDLLAVPSLDRKELLVIQAAGGTAAILGRVGLSGVADGNFARSGVGADATLEIPLAGGAIRRVALSRFVDLNMQ